jgi:hypothetical protein
MSVWIITCCYSDGSGYNLIEPAFHSEEEARWQINLLLKHSDKQFQLHRLGVK